MVKEDHQRPEGLPPPEWYYTYGAPSKRLEQLHPATARDNQEPDVNRPPGARAC